MLGDEMTLGIILCVIYSTNRIHCFSRCEFFFFVFFFCRFCLFQSNGFFFYIRFSLLCAVNWLNTIGLLRSHLSQCFSKFQIFDLSKFLENQFSIMLRGYQAKRNNPEVAQISGKMERKRKEKKLN